MALRSSTWGWGLQEAPGLRFWGGRLSLPGPAAARQPPRVHREPSVRPEHKEI